MDAKEQHRAATAEYTAASAEYEAAAMSGDHEAIVEADRRLRAADAAYGDTAAASLAEERRARRRALPSFEEMLAHPWMQPDELVYPNPAPSSTIDANPPKKRGSNGTS